jgi:hypothetical protein
MDIERGIEEYIAYFQELSESVALQPGSKGLPVSLDGEYKQKVYEVCDLLYIALGEKDPYPARLINVYANVRGDWDMVSLSNIKQILAFVQAALKKYQLLQQSPKRAISTNTPPYVDQNRLEELRGLKSGRLDFARLVRMCEELQIAHQGGNTISVAMLVRGILDHVPPVFSVKNFAELANNVSLGKSFLEAMKHLNEFSRKVADNYLHAQMRKHEPLPNATQVNCSAQLDLLLSEIVRIISTESRP